MNAHYLISSPSNPYTGCRQYLFIRLPHVHPTCSYTVKPGLHYLTQNTNVAISVQPEPLREEVGWHDVTFTTDDTKNHACCQKLSLHDSGHVFG